MSNYSFKKDPRTGRSYIVANDALPSIEQTQVVQPSTVTLDDNRPKRFRCKVQGCNKKFAGQGMACMHYNKNHKSSDDREEWRQFIEEA